MTHHLKNKPLQTAKLDTFRTKINVSIPTLKINPIFLIIFYLKSHTEYKSLKKKKEEKETSERKHYVKFS